MSGLRSRDIFRIDSILEIAGLILDLSIFVIIGGRNKTDIGLGCLCCGHTYTGWPNKNGTVDTVNFSGPCSDQQLSVFTLLDRASLSHYNNTKIIKFGRELFIL